MSRRNQLNKRVTSWEAAEQIFADIDSEDNFEDHNDDVSFPSADYMSQDSPDSDWEYDLDGVADLTLDDRPMDISPVSDEQQGGNEAGYVRPMSTLSGSNSDEDQDTAKFQKTEVPAPRSQLQYSCNETSNESDSPYCSEVSTPLQVVRGQEIYRRSTRVQNSRIAWDIDEADSYLPEQIPFAGKLSGPILTVGTVEAKSCFMKTYCKTVKITKFSIFETKWVGQFFSLIWWYLLLLLCQWFLFCSLCTTSLIFSE